MPHPNIEVVRPNCTLVAQPQPFLPRLSRAQCQELLAYLFASVLVLMLLTGAVIAYHYMTPQLKWVKLGNVEQFSTTRPTRLDIDTSIVWVVNHGDGFTVLHSITNDEAKCEVYWEEESSGFKAPCRGTRYTSAGVYALEGTPPERSLDRYLTRIETNGDLYIEITKPILGMTIEQMQAACIREYRGPSQYYDRYWLQLCILNRITGQ